MNIAILLQLAIVGAWAATILRHTRRLLRLAYANPAWASKAQTVRPLANRIWWWLGREEFWRIVQADALHCVQITMMAFLLVYSNK
jgi:hypothetical protein